MECATPDAGDAVANDDARQAAAVLECARIDDVGIATEGTTPNAGDAVGMVTLVRPVQPLNAPPPMLVTLLGMVTLVRPVHS